MGDKVFNSISITGFSDEDDLLAFMERAAKGTIPFSLDRLLPLPEPGELEQEEMRLHRELNPERDYSFGAVFRMENRNPPLSLGRSGEPGFTMRRGILKV